MSLSLVLDAAFKRKTRSNYKESEEEYNRQRFSNTETIEIKMELIIL